MKTPDTIEQIKTGFTVDKLLYHILSVLLLSILSTNSYAIVNMEGLHFGSDRALGVSGNIELLFQGTSGNTETSTASLESQLNWATEKYINILLLGYKYGEANGVKNIDNAFIHLRHVHNIDADKDWEIFSQLTQNEFTRLLYRGLVGGGFRFNIGNNNSHQAYLGTGLFYSKENIDIRPGLTDDGIYEENSANIYLLSRYKISETTKWSNALYYQPVLDESSDYRALFQSKIDLKISTNLDFRISLDIAYDSSPYQGVKKDDTRYATGLKWKF